VTGALDGMAVVVTGAGGGVGRGIALACATAGANVVVAARRTETGDPVAAEIERRGGGAVSVRCDVTSAHDVRDAVETAVATFGSLDCMVHNALAPVGEPRPITDVDDDTFRSMMGTAVRASYLCASAAYPHLEASRGSLIILTSAAGVEGSPYLPAYGMVKAAQRGLAKSLAQEWGPAGVRVNCIGPVAMTPAMELVAETSPVFTDGLLIGRTPLRRIGDPETDIGPVAVFLASDAARYMTGQTLMVDGGGFTAF
jgi:NAD(P)-dependent dehydrogenase (short-subunit alcohol dehydrogenase family)